MIIFVCVCVLVCEEKKGYVGVWACVCVCVSVCVKKVGIFLDYPICNLGDKMSQLSYLLFIQTIQLH